MSALVNHEPSNTEYRHGAKSEKKEVTMTPENELSHCASLMDSIEPVLPIRGLSLFLRAQG